ncbi:MAG: hypothetical protein KDM64_14605 [Verrucomicrobiae bacterium]|nr:hypothetical protein [Verrucomicrobiae bacterium]MCB1090107.1 hypothetical protein [Verrucomicrobiae bacterium]
MISPKIKAGCGVVAVFGLGFLLGGLCLLFVILKIVPLSEGWKSDRSKEFVANHLANQLDLTDEQRVQLRPIVDEALERRWKLRRDYLMEDQRLLNEEYFPEVAALLTDKQKEKARKLLERWKRDQKFKIDPSKPDAGAISSPPTP